MKDNSLLAVDRLQSVLQRRRGARHRRGFPVDDARLVPSVSDPVDFTARTAGHQEVIGEPRRNGALPLLLGNEDVTL